MLLHFFVMLLAAGRSLLLYLHEFSLGVRCLGGVPLKCGQCSLFQLLFGGACTVVLIRRYDDCADLPHQYASLRNTRIQDIGWAQLWWGRL